MIICKRPVHSDDHLHLSFVVCWFSLFFLLSKQVKQVNKVNKVNQVNLINQVNRINQVNQLNWMNQVQKKKIASDRGEGEEGGEKYQG